EGEDCHSHSSRILLGCAGLVIAPRYLHPQPNRHDGAEAERTGSQGEGFPPCWPRSRHRYSPFPLPPGRLLQLRGHVLVVREGIVDTANAGTALQGTSLRQRTQCTEVIVLRGCPRRARCPARATGLPDGLSSRVLPCSSPSPCGLPLRIPAFPLLRLRLRRGCRGHAGRRRLDALQPQLACLPPQRLDLLLLHLRLVLLLTVAHVRQAVLERQLDDPCQLVRRRGHGRLRPQPPLH